MKIKFESTAELCKNSQIKTVYESNVSKLPNYLLKKTFQSWFEQKRQVYKECSHVIETKLKCNSKPVKSDTGMKSVSNEAIQLYYKLTELGIWVSVIQNACKREERFFNGRH